MNSLPDKNFTLDNELANDADYKVCLDIINFLTKTGVIHHVAGNCIAAADLFQQSLKEYNISSRMVECKVIITKKDTNKIKNLTFVGFDSKSSAVGLIDTHVIVITETKLPMIIDLSIGDSLPSGRSWVVERLSPNVDPDIISKIDYPECSLSYSIKKMPRLLGLHQTSILDRLSQEINLKKRLSFLQSILIILGVLTFVNFTLNISILMINFFT